MTPSSNSSPEWANQWAQAIQAQTVQTSETTPAETLNRGKLIYLDGQIKYTTNKTEIEKGKVLKPLEILREVNQLSRLDVRMRTTLLQGAQHIIQERKSRFQQLGWFKSFIAYCRGVGQTLRNEEHDLKNLMALTCRNILMEMRRQPNANVNEIKALAMSLPNGLPYVQYKIGLYYLQNQDDTLAKEYFKLSAGQGYPIAHLELGKIYFKEHLQSSLSSDTLVKKAIECFSEASRNGVIEAEERLGDLYQLRHGRDTYHLEHDTFMPQAIKHYTESARLGNAEGLYKLSLIHKNGIGEVPINANVAFSFLQQAAQQGHARAQFELSQIYLNRVADESDPNKKVENIVCAFAWAARSDYKGHPEAQQWFRQLNAHFIENQPEDNPHTQLIIGLLYYHDMVPNSALTSEEKKQRALDALQSAHSQGLTAGYQVAFLLQRKLSLSSTADERQNIIQLIKKSATNGNPFVQLHLAQLYNEGNSNLGLEKNPVEAFKWYHQAAQQNVVEAQLAIAKKYKELGNHDKAIEWYQRAANQGNMEAQIQLAKMNLEVLTLPKKWMPYNTFGDSLFYHLTLLDEGERSKILDPNQNFDEAVKWFKISAMRGNSESQVYLGELHRVSMGSDRNYHDVLFWYQKAAEQGDSNATSRLNDMHDIHPDIFHDKLLRYSGVSSYVRSENDPAGQLRDVNLRYEKNLFTEALDWNRIMQDSDLRTRLSEVRKEYKRIADLGKTDAEKNEASLMYAYMCVMGWGGENDAYELNLVDAEKYIKNLTTPPLVDFVKGCIHSHKGDYPAAYTYLKRFIENLDSTRYSLIFYRKHAGYPHLYNAYYYLADLCQNHGCGQGLLEAEKWLRKGAKVREKYDCNFLFMGPSLAA